MIDEQMASVVQRKRAVTHGRRLVETSALDAVVSELRERDAPALRVAA
ncbi:MAG TPA: hypothetical protein VGO80_22625 [Solirubrobacteraceae bacterium]|jgi:hypothetical protein|nr:hypothetical protein [Solirubrobacteraceae bacterium]